MLTTLGRIQDLNTLLGIVGAIDFLSDGKDSNPCKRIFSEQGGKVSNIKILSNFQSQGLLASGSSHAQMEISPQTAVLS